ncbi:MAG TPA: hypothetical protein PJ982_14115, partial [Lacipirellulaceae bacterium]|nr:hypothetical protein [Lacipirellulaceae bacterium]
AALAAPPGSTLTGPIAPGPRLHPVASTNVAAKRKARDPRHKPARAEPHLLAMPLIAVNKRALRERKEWCT